VLQSMAAIQLTLATYWPKWISIRWSFFQLLVFVKRE